MQIYSAVKRGPRVRVAVGGRSRTKQSFADESNIDLIMAKYVKTGLIDHFATHGAEYGFASSIDFHSAMNVVTKADQMFDALPAEVRLRFNGKPGEFLDFVQEEENFDEMVKLGLANPRTEEAVVPPTIVEEPPAGPPEGSAPVAPVAGSEPALPTG